MAYVLAQYLRRLPRRSLYVSPIYSGAMLEYKKIYNGVKKLCKEYGVPEVTPHELRHSRTKLWMQNGASIEEIKRLLNHKSNLGLLGVMGWENSKLNLRCT